MERRSITTRVLVSHSSLQEPVKEATRHAGDVVEKEVRGSRRQVAAELERSLRAQD